MGKLSDEQKINLVKDYTKENVTTGDLARKYGIRRQSVVGILKKRGIPIRQQIRYSLNEDFFDAIDTEEKAYILGFLYADGYNCEKRGQVNVTLHERDEDILIKMNSLISPDRPLYKIKTDKAIHKRMTFNSKKMCQRLSELGCHQAKSLTIKFPTNKQVPRHLIRHFVRGYFDGDGYLGIKWKTVSYVCKPSIIASTSFCQAIHSLLKEMKIDNSLRLKDKVCYVEISNTHSGLRFLEWIYKNSKIYMNRKYDKYMDSKTLTFEKKRNFK